MLSENERNYTKTSVCNRKHIMSTGWETPKMAALKKQPHGEINDNDSQILPDRPEDLLVLNFVSCLDASSKKCLGSGIPDF